MNTVDLLFSTGGRRRLTGWLAQAVNIYAAVIAVGIVYATTVVLTDILALTIVFLAAMLALVFLTIQPRSGEETAAAPGIIDWLLAGLAIATGLYFWGTLDIITKRIALFDDLSGWDIAFGSVSLALIVEATRRTTGMGLTIIVLGFVAYNLLGHRLDGVLGHGYVSYEHFLDLTLFTTDGVYGVPVRVAATYAFLFVLFGSLLAKAGGGEFFHNMGAVLAGRTTGGTAKIAVVSSGMFGMVSGSPTADVVTTGAITMPMMERAGHSKTQSGGIEVAASTGGSIMPPVMGSVAFIMAEYTGIPYADIALAAIVPALLYYLGVMTQVHFLAKRQGLRGLPDDQIPGFVRALKGGEVFVIPLVVLIVALVMGYSATRVAVIGSVAVFLTALFRAESRIGLRGLFECLSETTVRCVAVTAACAAAGMVIGGLNMTGLAAKFSNMILLFSGGELFISLVIAGAITVLLGMGMPTPSAYILAVVLVGPALARLGMDQMTANMFLLYFAVMSASTPPVAVAAFAAAAICQANPIHIAAQATRLSIAAFVVPFTFAYSPVLLLRGEVLDIAWAVVTAVIGIWLVAVAVEGFFRVRIAPWARVVLGAGGLCFIATNPWAPLAGAALAAVALAPQFAGRTGARAT